MGSWTTRTGLNVKPTLIARARKRTGHKVGDGYWSIDGDGSLGDSYPAYAVYYDGKWACSCVSNTEYHKTCSHIVWAMLERKGVVKGVVVEKVEVEVEQPGVTYPVVAKPTGGQPLLPVEVLPPLVLSHYEPPMPDWLAELRPHQTVAVNEILNHFSAGKKVVFLDAPTGSGKTLIGELVRREQSRQAIYACTTKTLQDQVLRDYPYAKMIKGRSNYPTLDKPGSFPFLTAESCHLSQGGKCNRCTGAPKHCDQCHPWNQCPYAVAKWAAEEADLAVLNTAYFLGEGNTRVSVFKDRALAIIDEADQLEDELMRHIEVVVSKNAMKELGIGPPKLKTKADSWVTWVNDTAIPAVTNLLNNMRPMGKLDAKGRKRRVRYTRLSDKLHKLVIPAGMGDSPLADGWVYTGYDKNHVVFKPIRVDKLAADALWHLADRWLLMSATIISADQMAKDLGLKEEDWALVTVGSTFDKDRRPIYVEPIASMTYKEMATSLPPMLARVRQIAAHHADERILIHTVSYKLAAEVVSSLLTHFPGDRVFSYGRARDREQALDDFLSHPRGIMVAPSFERGVDLQGDDCRVVIIVKIPYPTLADKQISARLRLPGGNGWYSMNTVRTLVQMTGRAMRSEEDHCEIYLLDRQFMQNVWRKSRQLLPAWWREALVMGGSDVPR